MKSIAILGDGSTHGGTIITATGNFTVDDKPGVVDGDTHSCPIPGHGVTRITSTGTASADGRGIIRTGDYAGCGASIIGSGSATCDD